MNLRISTEQSLPLDSYAPLDPLIERGNYVTTAPYIEPSKALTSCQSLDMRKLPMFGFAPMIPHPTNVEFLLNRYHLG